MPRNFNDEVFWTTKGKVLHQSASCPAFRRAVNRVQADIASGDYRSAGDIRCYSFDENNMTQAGDRYPPESYDLCRLPTCKPSPRVS